MKSNKKLIALVCTLLLLVGAAGATLAWLTDQTEEVTNTFTIGDINITLDEVKVDEYGEIQKDANNNPIRIPVGEDSGNSYKMIPGSTYTKDPTVTVLPNSEACWLFVKVTKTGGVVTVDGETTTFEQFITHSVATGENAWTALGADYPGVYYIKVSKETAKAGNAYKVLTGDKVTIKDTVTKEMLDAVEATGTGNGSQYPELTFKAYAIQQANLNYGDAADDTAKAVIAWSQLPN